MVVMDGSNYYDVEALSWQCRDNKTTMIGILNISGMLV